MPRNLDKKKIHCLLCGASMREGFKTQWRHLVKKHPLELFTKITPMLENPGIAREAGAAMGNALLSYAMRKPS